MATDPKLYLYHYTDRTGIEGMLRTKQLKSSTNTSRDARYGVGAYFTELGPKSDTKWLITNNWDGMSVSPDRAKYYLRVDRASMPPERLSNFSQNVQGRVISIWVLEGTQPLNLNQVGAFFGRRKTAGKPKQVTLDNLTDDEDDD